MRADLASTMILVLDIVSPEDAVSLSVDWSFPWSFIGLGAVSRGPEGDQDTRLRSSGGHYLLGIRSGLGFIGATKREQKVLTCHLRSDISWSSNTKVSCSMMCVLIAS